MSSVSIPAVEGSQAKRRRAKFTSLRVHTLQEWQDMSALPNLIIVATALLALGGDLARAQAPGIVPLTGWWSEANLDNQLRSSRRHSAMPNRRSYRPTGYMGLIFDPDQPQPRNTVPLWSWFSDQRRDTMVTSHSSWRAGGPDETRSPGYREPLLVGYVFDPDRPQPPGTVPLFRWWSDRRADNHTTNHPSWRGGRGETRDPSYHFSRVEGYVFPRPGASPARVPPRAERRLVVATVEEIRVHDDCDNVSPGDWALSLQAVESGRPAQVATALLPSGHFTLNVSTGQRLRPRLQVGLDGVPVTNRVQLSLTGIDCDADHGWVVPLLPFVLFTPVGLAETRLPPVPLHLKCDGGGAEEIFEFSGSDDSLGIASVNLTAEEWRRGGTFTLVPPPSTTSCKHRPDVSDPGGRLGWVTSFAATLRVRSASEDP
jgi:hypothetical protein